MQNNKIRWKQRFENFEKAYKLLEKYIIINNPTELERAGIIQFFQITFELSWKLAKDYLEAEGFNINSPRDALKQAFQIQLMKDGHTWIDALNDRNLAVHTYDENKAIEIEKRISQNYFPVIKKFYLIMQEKFKI